MKGQTYIILALLFALIIAIFAVINVDPVQVNFLFTSGEAPLILVILLSVLLGGLATASVGALRYFKLKKENRSLRDQLDKGADLKADESQSVDTDTQEEKEESSYKTT